MEEKGTYEQLLKLSGVTKDKIEKKIADFTSKNPNLKIQLNDVDSILELSVKTEAEDEKDAKKILKPVVRELKAEFGKYIFASDSEKTLEEAVVELLKSEHLTVTFAESCTGGAISSKIVNVEGASEVFGCGFVTYSDKAKRKNLLVKKGTLKTEGAVSAKCAKEMAKGACYVSGADVSISVTGFAGPDGGTKENPVGTVYIGCCFKGDTEVREFHFKGDRNAVRNQAVVYGLSFLRNSILDGSIKKSK